MAYPLTIRERLIVVLLDRLKAAQFLSPLSGALFNQVIRGDPAGLSNLSVPCAALEEGTEDVEDLLWPFYNKTLTFFVHVRIQRQLVLMEDYDLDSYAQVGLYFGEIHRVMCEKRYVGGLPDPNKGLAIDIQEVGNNLEVEGRTDPQPGGVIIFQLKYRHHNADPYVSPFE